MSFQLRLEEPIELTVLALELLGKFSLSIAFEAKEQGMCIWFWVRVKN